MNQSFKLSLEQEFTIRSFSDKVQMLSCEEAKQSLLMLYKEMLIREVMYQQLLKSK
ncbi:MAG: NblA/ycf18 family protein [Nostoc sp.]|uniref:NblA/ycf18 family protein n=1 Tax=Nostoc sp. TaxID=1180 RepID=UPI002FEE7D4B